LSTRSYSNLIVIESIFDSLTDTNADVLSLASSVFEPMVPVVEEDCGTTLGQIVDVNYELEGKIELATGLPFSHDRIIQLLTQGIYRTSVRDMSTCISEDGICQKCYHASRQKMAVPAVGTSVQILPEYVTFTEAITVHSGVTEVALSQSPDLYDNAYVYRQGHLLTNAEGTISGTTLTLSNPIVSDGYIVVRYTTIIRAPFLFWLAGTYSGSMLGIKELPAPNLPLRKRLLTSLVPQSMLESLATHAGDLNGVPPESVEFLPSVQDPLEKALFVMVLYAVYLNVN
jgi:hypothetical protein